MIKNDLIRWALERVAREMGWSDLARFERVDLPSPGLFALFNGTRAKVILVSFGAGPDVDVHAVEWSEASTSHCQQRVCSAALRAYYGDFGEAAKADARERFRRLKDLDLAEGA